MSEQLLLGTKLFMQIALLLENFYAESSVRGMPLKWSNSRTSPEKLMNRPLLRSIKIHYFARVHSMLCIPRTKNANFGSY